MLWWVVSRVGMARLVDKVVVATTTLTRDDEIAEFCAAQGWHCFRGAETDVLDRFHGAALEHGATSVVRLTADCPLIDPDVVDLAIATYRASAPQVDYASNCQRRTYPRGLDVEVFAYAALDRAWRQDTRADWREHVTPFIYRSSQFRLADVVSDEDRSGRRWTVDTPEDLDFVRRVVSLLGTEEFRWRDILAIEEAYPKISRLNETVAQKVVPR